MSDAGLYLKLFHFDITNGQQAKFLPAEASLLGLGLGRNGKLETVWQCDGSPMEHRTFMLLYLPAGQDMSKTVSPQWVMLGMTHDKVGGFIALLELPA